MRNLNLIILIALGGCVGSTTNSFNSADACKIVEQKKRAMYFQARREERKNRKQIPIRNGSTIPPHAHVATAVLPDVEIATTNDRSRLPTLVPDLPKKLIIEEQQTDTVREAKLFSPKPKIQEVVSNKQPVNANPIIPESVKRPAFTKFHQSAQSIMILALAGIAGMGLFKVSEKKMRNLSRWGMKNPAAARMGIAGAQTVAALGGMMLGHSLYSGGIEIPEFAYLASLTACAGAAAFYPSNYAAKSIPTFSYFRRKMHDMTLYTTGAMMMTYAGNHYAITTQPLENEKLMYSVVLPGGTSHHLALTRKSFSPYAGTTPKGKDPKRGERIAATVAVSFLFGLLGLVVAGLSCELSCAGNSVGAAAVGIGGTGLIIAGMILSVRAIYGLNKKKKAARTPPTP